MITCRKTSDQAREGHVYDEIAKHEGEKVDGDGYSEIMSLPTSFGVVPEKGFAMKKCVAYEPTKVPVASGGSATEQTVGSTTI